MIRRRSLLLSIIGAAVAPYVPAVPLPPAAQPLVHAHGVSDPCHSHLIYDGPPYVGDLRDPGHHHGIYIYDHH